MTFHQPTFYRRLVNAFVHAKIASTLNADARYLMIRPERAEANVNDGVCPARLTTVNIFPTLTWFMAT